MSTLDNIQMAYEILKKAGNLDAQNAIIELREDNVRLREEIQILKQKIGELEEELRIKRQIEFDGVVYWLKDAEKREGPYCHICYEKDRKLIHVSESTRSFFCKVCNTGFDKT
ncbi:MAG TPA: hypothetical protein VMW89_16270 [Desulfatiglandales bacterium]|nr:hypothetical protein [Desulfatiglandales bacterium]